MGLRTKKGACFDVGRRQPVSVLYICIFILHGDSKAGKDGTVAEGGKPRRLESTTDLRLRLPKKVAQHHTSDVVKPRQVLRPPNRLTHAGLNSDVVLMVQLGTWRVRSIHFGLLPGTWGENGEVWELHII